MTRDSAQNHVRITGFLTIASGVFMLFIPLILFLVSAGLLAAGAFGGLEGMVGGGLAGGIVGVVGLFFSIPAVVAIAAGFGILARKEWARVAGIVIAIWNLFWAFPISTAVGAYQLWVLMINAETRAAYRAPDSSSSAAWSA